MTLSNATLTFDFGSTPNPTNAWWQVGVLNVTTPVTNNVLGYAFTPGTIQLLQYTTLSGADGTAFTQPWNTLPPHVLGYYSNDTVNSSIDLVVTAVETPKWNGNVAGGAWDINTTANWVPVTGNGAITYLQFSVPGDSVLFNDSLTGTSTVNLTTNLSPSAITVNNSLSNYTFTGSGALSGPTGLTKDGTALLTLSNTGTNTFTGPVNINQGTVRIAGGANVLPTSAAVTLGNDPTAVLDLNNTNQMLGGLAGGGASGGNVTLGTGTLTLNGEGGNYGGVISGRGMVVQSGGTQTFTATNSYSGGTLVSGGTLYVANADPTGSGVGSGSVTVQTNGTLYIGDGGADGSIAATTITDNGHVYLNRSDALTFTNLLVGTGGFILNDTGGVIITNANYYSGQTTIGYGPVSITDPGALGTGLIFITEVDSAVLQLPGGITLTQAINLDLKTGGSSNPGIQNLGGTNILAGPITLNAGGTYWNVESDAGDLILQGACSTVAGLSGGSHTLKLLGAGNGEWWGALNNSSGGSTTGVQIGGPGAWTLWGTNGYTGGTSVGGGGQLNVNGALTATSAVTVTGGAALSGNGLIAGPVAISSSTLCGNSVSVYGIPTGAAAGRLTISNSLTLDPSTTTVLGVSHGGCDQVAGLTSVSFGCTLTVVQTGALYGGEVFKLFSSDSYSGDFNQPYNLPYLGPLLGWDTNSVPVNGTLRVTGTSVPQVLSVSSSGPGNLQLSGIGPTNWTYIIVATTNVALPLSDWVQVSSGTFVNGTFSFSDSHAATYPNRFYQVVTQTQ
jgi:autotransporter-associated beta strand protein